MSTTTVDPPDVELTEGPRNADVPPPATPIEVVYFPVRSRLTEDELDELRWGADGGNNLD